MNLLIDLLRRSTRRSVRLEFTTRSFVDLPPMAYIFTLKNWSEPPLVYTVIFTALTDEWFSYELASERTRSA